MTKREAWDFALTVIGCDELKISEQMKTLIEKEKSDEITVDNILDILNEIYKK